MTIAEIHGKLGSRGSNISDRLEDLLTSDVFSTCKYLNPEDLLIPFLEMSLNLNEEHLSLGGQIKSIDYKFWLRLKNCEPDLIIEIKRDKNKNILLLIESKYLSGKSSNPLSDEELEIAEVPRDQLAKEFNDLIDEAKDKEPYLIYITAHRTMPKKHLEDSAQEMSNFMKSEIMNRLYWNNWFNLYDVIKNKKNSVSSNNLLILEDLEELMEKKNLIKFDGFKISEIGRTFAFYKRHG